ncbi:MAG: hypothetical protein ACRC41_09365 [Sarcina sp.]
MKKVFMRSILGFAIMGIIAAVYFVATTTTLPTIQKPLLYKNVTSKTLMVKPSNYLKNNQTS